MDKSMGNRMKVLRDKNDLKQSELAKRAGITESYYSRIETGANSPSVETLESIANELHVSVIFLLNDRIEEMEIRVEDEEERLLDIFKEIPKTQFQLVEGLIKQAARLRVLLDDNWKDILEHGEYEKFQQSETQKPYDRKRPIVENYDNRDKTYQNIIKQLTDMLPQKDNTKKSAKDRLLGK